MAAGTEALARRRPGEGDKDVLRAAAVSFAAWMAKDCKDYLDGVEADGFVEDLLRVLPVWHDDGTQLAQALHDRGGYPFDREAIEALASWGDHLRVAVDEATRAWVVETSPLPPFESVARAVVGGARGEREGTAYRNDGGDALARCMFVPDAERSRFMRDGAFAGGEIVPWERVRVEGAATEDDARALRAMAEGDARYAREREYRTFAYALERRFAAAVADEARLARGLAPDELAGRLGQVLGGLAREAGDGSGPGSLDPFSPRAALAEALLAELRERAKRARHQSAPEAVGGTAAQG